ncbi:MAG: hypothetical protein R2851_17195 [Caldilineaceae bacterium]
MANAAADMWQDFGIDVNLQGLERSVWEQNLYSGQFEISVPWRTFVLASGDSWPEVNGIHPKYVVPVGEDARSAGGTSYTIASRITDPKIGEFIDQMATLDPSSEANFELNREFLKYWTENMYFITAIALKKFVTWDERLLDRLPHSRKSRVHAALLVPGGKFAFQSLKPVE